MHTFAAKAGLLLAVAAITVTGGAYAASATSRSHADAPPPLRNISSVYTVATPGGNGRETYQIPSPPPGIYQASFTANFDPPQGSKLAFSCLLVKNGATNLAQSTSTGRTTSDFYVGVDGLVTMKVNPGDELTAVCGLTQEVAWRWGDRPLRVMLTRLDGATFQQLPSANAPGRSTVGVG